MGKGHGGRLGEGFLEDHEFTALQRTPDRFLVGHGLSGIGARDPKSFDLAVGCSLEHLNSSFPRFGGHRFHAPQASHFFAVQWIGQIALG